MFRFRRILGDLVSGWCGETGLGSDMVIQELKLWKLT